MRRLVLGVVAFSGAAVSAAGFLACSTQNGGAAGAVDASMADAGMQADVMMEATGVRADVQEEPQPCNEQTCGGACCGGQCIPRNCGLCDAGSTFCPFEIGIFNIGGYCVGGCNACDAGGVAAPVTCFNCGSSGVPAGTCSTDPTSCPVTVDGGACPCASGDAGECGSTQVCAGSDAGFVCLTCGQDAGGGGTDKLTCANRQTCHQATSSCGP